MAGEGKLRLSRRQRGDLARAVHETEQATGLQVTVYIGPTEEDPATHAERLLHSAGALTSPAVLVLVAPAARRVELRTAPTARERLPDEASARVVAAITAGFARGDAVGGLREGLDVIREVAGPPPAGSVPGEELPDVLAPRRPRWRNR